MNQRLDPAVEKELNDIVGQVDGAETETATPSPAAQSAAAPAKRKGGGRRLVLMFGVPVLLVAGGSYFYLTGGRYESTDNAYVQQSIVSLSADVSGRIVEVDVAENEHVTAGQVLFRIDPEPYRIALAQAEAALANSRISVDQLRVSYLTAEAKLETARNTLDIEQRARDRIISLTNKGISTEAANDDSLLSLEQARSAVDLAEQSLASAAAALGGDPDIATDDHPAVKAALASVDSARRNLEKTTVLAPAAGIVSQVSSLNAGQVISAGGTVASLVETDASWLEANFKETQLGNMQIGQKVEVDIDSFAGTHLEGTVASIGAATGAEFSLIPAQNATGNWVKVVQRIPVRIEVDGVDALDLRSGMSAKVSVDTGKTLLDRLL